MGDGGVLGTCIGSDGGGRFLSYSKILRDVGKGNIHSVYENSEKGEETFTLEVVVPSHDSKTKRIAREHGVDLGYLSSIINREKSKRTPVLRIKCPPDKLEESAKILMATHQDL